MLCLSWSWREVSVSHHFLQGLADEKHLKIDTSSPPWVWSFGKGKTRLVIQACEVGSTVKFRLNLKTEVATSMASCLQPCERNTFRPFVCLVASIGRLLYAIYAVEAQRHKWERALDLSCYEWEN